MSPGELTTLLDILRKAGVQRFRDGDVEVVLHPSTPSSQPPPADPFTRPDKGGLERCPCGHELDAEHNDGGLCLRGCVVALCHPETVKKE